jgi:hypothetical protein
LPRHSISTAGASEVASTPTGNRRWSQCILTGVPYSNASRDVALVGGMLIDGNGGPPLEETCL